MCSGLPLVELVLKLLPQLHVTSISVYFGCIFSFMICSLDELPEARCHRAGKVGDYP